MNTGNDFNPSQFAQLALQQTPRPAPQTSGTDENVNLNAARQFESLLIHTMLKAMRASIPKSDLFQSNASDLYSDLFDQRIAEEISAADRLGLAEVIHRQISAAPVTRTAPTIAEQPAVINEAGRDSKPPSSNHRFINEVQPSANLAASLLGTSSTAVMAIAAHESGWGKRVISQEDGNSSYNLFGIKADKTWSGDRATATTHEFLGTNLKKIRADFRAYTNVDEAATDFASFILNNPRYQQARQHASQPDQFIRELQKAGYATDPNYANKVIRLMRQIENMRT